MFSMTTRVPNQIGLDRLPITCQRKKQLKKRLSLKTDENLFADYFLLELNVFLKPIGDYAALT